MDQKRDYYSVADIQEKFGCGIHKAESIIRAIKAYVPDPLPIRGKVLVTEYEAWKNRLCMSQERS